RLRRGSGLFPCTALFRSDSIINDWTGSRTVADVANRLEEYSVPCGKIYRAPEMLDDPHFKARNSIVATPTERWPELKMQNVFPVDRKSTRLNSSHVKISY